MFRYVRNLERGFSAIWGNYLEGNLPRHISVEDVGFEYYEDVDDSNNTVIRRLDVDDSNNTVIRRLVSAGFSSRFSSVDWNGNSESYPLEDVALYDDEEYADDSFDDDIDDSYDDDPDDSNDDDTDDDVGYEDSDDYDVYDEDDDEYADYDDDDSLNELQK